MDTFLADVHAGLSSAPKTLPSKYFYDAVGDALFVKIMAMPEYYLTRAEMEIFSAQSEQIVDSFKQSPDIKFDLIELGAGDGTKTAKLLSELLRRGNEFDYIPIDISTNALAGLEARLSNQMPELNITPRAGDYFRMLAELRETQHPKVVLFLGSNIGNMQDSEAHDFINGLSRNLSVGDRLLLGVDLIKPNDVVLPAYSDAQGLTRDFNLNLLKRINDNLGGDFQIDQFEHLAEYTQEEGVARSYLVSKQNQHVTLRANNHCYTFAAGEKLRTEVSRKYNDDILTNILRGTRLRMVEKFTDSGLQFADYLLEQY